MGATEAISYRDAAAFYAEQRERARRKRRWPNNHRQKPLPDLDATLAILDEPDPPGLDAILAAWEAAHDADRR